MKLYYVSVSKAYAGGWALVAAHNAEEAKMVANKYDSDLYDIWTAEDGTNYPYVDELPMLNTNVSEACVIKEESFAE